MTDTAPHPTMATKSFVIPAYEYNLSAQHADQTQTTNRRRLRAKTLPKLVSEHTLLSMYNEFDVDELEECNDEPEVLLDLQADEDDFVIFSRGRIPKSSLQKINTAPYFEHAKHGVDTLRLAKVDAEEHDPSLPEYNLIRGEDLDSDSDEENQAECAMKEAGKFGFGPEVYGLEILFDAELDSDTAPIVLIRNKPEAQDCFRYMQNVNSPRFC